jgi:hypothetical protein
MGHEGRGGGTHCVLDWEAKTNREDKRTKEKRCLLIATPLGVVIIASPGHHKPITGFRGKRGAHFVVLHLVDGAVHKAPLCLRGVVGVEDDMKACPAVGQLQSVALWKGPRRTLHGSFQTSAERSPASPHTFLVLVLPGMQVVGPAEQHSSVSIAPPAGTAIVGNAALQALASPKCLCKC